MNRVTIKPELLTWAIKRSGKVQDDFAKKLPKLPDWLAGRVSPTLKQLETFARATYTPVGYFFLTAAPDLKMPIPDFRSMPMGDITEPSPNLLDTLHMCQQRQEWYQAFTRSLGSEPLPFVDSADISDDVSETAEKIRRELGFDLEKRRKMRTWTDALRSFIGFADDLGVLVMVSGIVGNNTHRKLDPEEFRGFTLVDDLAPLIFINGADSKSAQMFTLAHELAHIWLGETAVSAANMLGPPDHRIERWCNQVAAELLVPMDVFMSSYDPSWNLHDEMNRLARRFKVSTLVILRRIYDAGDLSHQDFWQEYNTELDRLKGFPKSSGGDFYLTQGTRLSKRFARAIVMSTLEGHTLYRDAFRMLGLKTSNES